MGVAPEALLDFSSNTNPLPLSREFQQVLTENIRQITRLPEVDSAGVRRALAQRFHMDPAQFLVSGGTTHWIYALPRVFRPRRVLIPVPTYADYYDAASQARIPVITIKGWKDGSPVSLEHVLHYASDATAPGDMVFICNPNNPTGTFASPDIVAETVQKHPETIWIIDESYAPFVAEDQKSSLLSGPLPSNCLVLRSFSKIYGIPGLRLGYAAGNRKTVKELETCMEPWQVNRLAQLAGEWLARERGDEAHIRKFCQKEKKNFLKALSGLSCVEYMPGHTHFMLFRLHCGMTAEELCRRLLQKRILIRNCSNFYGFDNGPYVRISPGTSEENQILARELTKIFSRI